MNAWQKAACAAGIVVAGVTAGVAITACTTPVRSKLSLETAGFRLTSEVDINGTMTLHISGPLPPGKCLKLTGRSSNGEEKGAGVIHVPGSWTVPPGSTFVDIETVNCGRSQPTSSTKASDVAAQSPQLGTGDYTDIFGVPLVFDYADGGLLKNVAYHFRVRNAGSSAWDEIFPILVRGPGAPVPPEVEVLSFTQTLPTPFGARVLAADTDVFTEFRLDWNGRVGYADLAQGINTLQYAAPNHWNVVEAFIGALDIQPFGVENRAVTTRRTQLESQAESAAAAILYIP